MQPQTFLIYNVTNKLSSDIHEEWLSWMKDHHIPAVLATRCFFKADILRLKDVDDTDGPTYAIQYHSASQSNYNLYVERFAAELRKETLDTWGNQFIAFRTVLEVVN